jgi:hypothetical protein
VPAALTVLDAWTPETSCSDSYENQSIGEHEAELKKEKEKEIVKEKTGPPK